MIREMGALAAGMMLGEGLTPEQGRSSRLAVAGRCPAWGCHPRLPASRGCGCRGPTVALHPTMRFGITAKVLLKCKLKYYHPRLPASRGCGCRGPTVALHPTMRFGSTAKVLLKCKLKYYHPRLPASRGCGCRGPTVALHPTMRFGSTAKVLLKCKLKYYRISECIPALTPQTSGQAGGLPVMKLVAYQGN